MRGNGVSETNVAIVCRPVVRVVPRADRSRAAASARPTWLLEGRLGQDLARRRGQYQTPSVAFAHSSFKRMTLNLGAHPLAMAALAKRARVNVSLSREAAERPRRCEFAQQRAVIGTRIW